MQDNLGVSSKFIVLSGGFDPIHEGHLAMINAAKLFGKVAVILNTDEWLLRKKGYFLQGVATRKAILGTQGVQVWESIDEESDNVVATLQLKQDNVLAFANGGDRIPTNTPEVEWCLKNKIPLIFGVGGGKINSSSEMVERALNSLRTRSAHADQTE